MFRLPVSGVEVEVRAPAGAEDLLLLEAPRRDTALALTLVGMLAHSMRPGEIDWGELTVTDLDTLLLQIRAAAFGDQVRATARCPNPACGEPIDISFRISDYLVHDPPRRPRNVEPAEEAGWFRLTGTEATFRLPTVADQVAASREANPTLDLVRRCIRPAGTGRDVAARIQRAMAALAPELAGELQNRCPHCGEQVTLYFDPQEFTVRELSEQAGFIHQDVHLLAWHYHWSEKAILALPRERRAQYVELVRSERKAA